MSAARIWLHADHAGYPIEFRCAAIDVVQPVMQGDFCAYCNVQVGNRVYQVSEKLHEIGELRARAEEEAAAVRDAESGVRNGA